MEISQEGSQSRGPEEFGFRHLKFWVRLGPGESCALTLGILQCGDSADGLPTQQWLPRMVPQDDGMSISMGGRGTKKKSNAELSPEMAWPEGTLASPIEAEERESQHRSQGQIDYILSQ